MIHLQPTPLGLFLALVGSTVPQAAPPQAEPPQAATPQDAAARREVELHVVVQEPGGAAPEPGELRPIRIRALSARPGFDAPRWRELLTHPDLDRREAALDELLRLVPASVEARETLEAWASLSTEPLLAWTARLALRELRGRSQQAFWMPLPTSLRTADMASGPEDRLEQRLLRFQLRAIPPLGEALFDHGGSLSLLRPRVLALPAGASAAQVERRFALERSSEGVRLLVTERSAGQELTHQYAAESLERLLAEHPELAGRVPGLKEVSQLSLRPDGALWSWGRGGPLQLHLDARGWREPPASFTFLGVQLGGGEPPTDVLGVVCVPVPSEKGLRCGLEPGVGLIVDSTVPGTIAYEVEVQRGDILVELNGLTLRSTEDISAALRELEEGQELTVRLVDQNGQRRTVTWRRASDAPGAERRKR